MNKMRGPYLLSNLESAEPVQLTLKRSVTPRLMTPKGTVPLSGQTTHTLSAHPSHLVLVRNSVHATSTQQPSRIAGVKFVTSDSALRKSSRKTISLSTLFYCVVATTQRKNNLITSLMITRGSSRMCDGSVLNLKFS